MISDGTETVQTASNLDYFSQLPTELTEVIVKHSVDGMVVDGMGMDERAKWLGKLRLTSRRINSDVRVFVAEIFIEKIASVAHCLQVVPTSTGESQIVTALSSIRTDQITKLWIKVPFGSRQSTFLDPLLPVTELFKSVLCARVDFDSDSMTYTCLWPRDFGDLSEGLKSLKEICLTNVIRSDYTSTYRMVANGVRTIAIYSPTDGMQDSDNEWSPEEQFQGWLEVRGLYGSHLAPPQKPSYTLVLERSLTGLSIEAVRQGMDETLERFCDEHDLSAAEHTSLQDRIQCTDRWAMFEDPPVRNVTDKGTSESDSASRMSVYFELRDM
ncbi:hypothetical protein BCR39DRAFT_562643 [Naematelia encephala]|uniref:Uncharacterized protein n=1 Tax=Naematelia encephala TaxID=71784 RepID=A0A1Y2AGQ2_9TREE|nr:hypothetical protein BCR39DRAFT_562643 [Naematelia encephala]